jgi:hypothetical protein
MLAAVDVAAGGYDISDEMDFVQVTDDGVEMMDLQCKSLDAVPIESEPDADGWSR